MTDAMIDPCVGTGAAVVSALADLLFRAWACEKTEIARDRAYKLDRIRAARRPCWCMPDEFSGALLDVHGNPCTHRPRP